MYLGTQVLGLLAGIDQTYISKPSPVTHAQLWITGPQIRHATCNERVRQLSYLVPGLSCRQKSVLEELETVRMAHYMRQ